MSRMIALPRQPDMRGLLGKARFSPLMLMIIAGITALVAAAAAFAAYAILAPDPSPPASASIDWKAPRPSTDDLGPPRLASSDTQILTRPIFNKDRRPTPPKAVAKPTSTGPVSDTPTGLKVIAIVKHRKESRAFVNGANGKGEWKTVGEKVDDWTISEIASQQLIVSNGVATAHLDLYSDKPAPDSLHGLQEQLTPAMPSADYVEPPEQKDPEAALDRDAPLPQPPPQSPQQQVGRPPQPAAPDAQEMRQNMRP